MLVPRSTVDKWYQTDSWVYKSFSFLFKNPLWDKTIPKGFSVCPYFWLSIVSIFFRIFVVWPTQFIILPILNLCGTVATEVDEALFNFWKKVGVAKAHTQAKGIGVLITLCMTAGILMLGMLVIGGIIKAVAVYPYVTGSALGMFAYWSIASFVSLFAIIFIHKTTTKTECKTMAYLYVWLLLFLVAAPICIPSELGAGFGQVLSSIGVVLATVAGWIWFAVKFLVGWAWFGIVWAPIPSLYSPWWGYLLAASGIAWVLAFFFGKYVDFQNEQYRQETTPEFWDRNRDNWLSLFGRVLTLSAFYRDGDLFGKKLDSPTPDWQGGKFKNNSPELNKAAYQYRSTLYRKALQLYLADKLEELKTTYPLVKYDKWKEFAEYSGTELRFTNISELLNDIRVPNLNFSTDEFDKYVLKAMNDGNIKELLDDTVAQIRTDNAIKAAKKLASRFGWATTTCRRVTTALSFGASKVANFVVWFCTQLGTFFCYLWILVKAKKKGACPYLTFTDPVHLPPQAPSSRATNSPNNPRIKFNLKD